MQTMPLVVSLQKYCVIYLLLFTYILWETLIIFSVIKPLDIGFHYAEQIHTLPLLPSLNSSVLTMQGMHPFLGSEATYKGYGLSWG